MIFIITTEDLILSPINYMGNKGKLLQQLIPLIPTDIDNFIDVFAGSFTVGINAKADNLFYNDICTPLYNLIKYMHENKYEDIKSAMMEVYAKYNPTSYDGYINLRNAYNNSEDKPAIMLYTLIANAFNYEIRFNKKGGYNIPFGYGYTYFSASLEQKLNKFVNVINNKNVQFYNMDYIKFLNSTVSYMTEKSFVYLDPPYFNTSATYNNAWTSEDEIALRTAVDVLIQNNIRFLLSNDASANINLEQWALNRDLNVIHLRRNYNNCVYTKWHGKSDEIAICNYAINFEESDPAEN